MVLKSIGVLSAAKIVGVMYAVMGLLTGLMMAAIFSMIPSMASASDPSMNQMPSWIAPMFGVGSIVILPIMYGIMGFIGGAIGAVIYNALAGMIGGLVLNLEPTHRA